jgi:hypothetical protein
LEPCNLVKQSLLRAIRLQGTFEVTLHADSPNRMGELMIAKTAVVLYAYLRRMYGIRDAGFQRLNGQLELQNGAVSLLQQGAQFLHILMQCTVLHLEILFLQHVPVSTSARIVVTRLHPLRQAEAQLRMIWHVQSRYSGLRRENGQNCLTQHLGTEKTEIAVIPNPPAMTVCQHGR